MAVKTTLIPIEPLIALLKSLDEDAKEEIFKKVFIEKNVYPLTREEKEVMARAKKELDSGETIKWSFGR